MKEILEIKKLHKLRRKKPKSTPKNQTFLGFYQPEADRNEELDKMFDIFWKEYPKKVAKAYTKKIFKRLNPTKGLFQTIITVIARQKSCDQWKRSKGQYIPNPSTWLNQERWDDELTYKETTAEQIDRLRADGKL